MKVAMAIAIIAAGLFSIFGIIFIVSSFRNIKREGRNEKKIKELEEGLEKVETIILERTAFLAAKLEESSMKAAAAAPAAPTPAAPVSAAPIEEIFEIEEIDDLEGDDEISIEDLFDEDFEDLLTEEKGEAPAAASAPGPEVKPEAKPEENSVYPPSKSHRGYDVGRSGRKYTATELEDLIRA